MINFGLTLHAADEKKKKEAAKKADVEAQVARRHSQMELRKSQAELRRSQRCESRPNSEAANSEGGKPQPRSAHDEDVDLSTDPSPIQYALKVQALRNKAWQAQKSSISLDDMIVDIRHSNLAKKAIAIARSDLDFTCRWLFPLCYFVFVAFMLILLATVYSEADDCHFAPGEVRFVA